LLAHPDTPNAVKATAVSAYPSRFFIIVIT
jgi:hypothetical protein